MVGAFPVVGSSVVDSNTCSCLCLDVMPLSNLSRVESVLPRNSMGRKHRPRPGSLDLSSSFLDFSSVKAITRTKNLKKHRKMRRVIVDELAGQYEDNFGDVTSQILDYFTYKAVRTVLNQLYEMNPTQYRWFYDYVATNEHGYGKRFLRNLGKEKHELAERVMVTRLHLYGKWIKVRERQNIIFVELMWKPGL
ncbi:Hypothetical predicted protein [Olea europaea subsp. europaea]|uniref:Uncharacterized protein n=1 Tax=Olea europaea subsp. europaea TaxID=158383 RepID=A0A8S0T1V0_OLEEU|nr:Hypothetical predicted protein [Olea europaea subsp. europaea]